MKTASDATVRIDSFKTSLQLQRNATVRQIFEEIKKSPKASGKEVEDNWKLGGEKERWRHNGELGGEMEDKCGKTARGSHADAPWEPERAVQPVP